MPVDLLLIVEGRDDEAVLSALLERPKDMGICPITFDFRRRSGAVLKEGVNVASQERNNFRKVILIWDHADSPYADRTPQRAQGIVQAELNKRTLRGCSKAITVDPELEIWLWQDYSAVAQALGVRVQDIERWLKGWQRALKQSVGDRGLQDLMERRQVNLQRDSAQTLLEKLPKEALKWVCRQAKQKADSQLRGRIAQKADLKKWERNESFRWLCQQLRQWFPPSLPAGQMPEGIGTFLNCSHCHQGSLGEGVEGAEPLL